MNNNNNNTKNIINQILAERENEYNWAKKARPDQIIPDGDWRIWTILAGRGFGKTRTGAEAIKTLVENGYKNICLLGETMLDVRKVMVEGESGLLSVYHPTDRPIYYPSKETIEWPNGTKAHLFSSERPDALRGPQFDCAWVDELAKFSHLEECWNQLMMTMRLGDPKIIITTTPKPIPLIKKIIQRPDCVVIRGSTMANANNLPSCFIQNILQEYDNTKFGRQEIYGEILEEDDSILWIDKYFKYTAKVEYMDNVVISVDPAVTQSSSSDETGIVVTGTNADGYYVIEDLSCKASVLDWIKTVIEAYYLYGASKVIIETNQGGEIFKDLIAQEDSAVEVVEVRAIKNKFTRAQPIAMMYQKGEVHHMNKFDELENQMLNFNTSGTSPDRVDALVWGLNYLKRQFLYDIC